MVTLKLGVLCQRGADFVKDTRRVLVWRVDEAIVHPLAVASRLDDTSSAQISQVTRDLWLADFQDGHKEADTNL